MCILRHWYWYSVLVHTRQVHPEKGKRTISLNRDNAAFIVNPALPLLLLGISNSEWISRSDYPDVFLLNSRLTFQQIYVTVIGPRRCPAEGGSSSNLGFVTLGSHGWIHQHLPVSVPYGVYQCYLTALVPDDRS